jgi:hypothetical protein
MLASSLQVWLPSRSALPQRRCGGEVAQLMLPAWLMALKRSLASFRRVVSLL